MCVCVCVLPVESGVVVRQGLLLVGSRAVVVINSLRKDPPGLVLKVTDTHTLPRHHYHTHTDSSSEEL